MLIVAISLAALVAVAALGYWSDVREQERRRENRELLRELARYHDPRP